MTLLWGRATHLRRLGPRVRVRELTAFFRKRLPLRSVSALSVALFCWSSAGQAAAAEGEPRSRPVELGLSSGYSVVGFGHRLQADDFDTLWAIPLLVDVGYRASKHWTFGAYGELGFIDNSPEVEDADESISGHHFRVGAQAIYHSSPERRVQPWFGVGLGYDALRTTYRSRSTLPPLAGARPDPGISYPIRADGFELGHAQLGIDFAFVPWLAFGPFFSGSVVSYGNQRGIQRSDGFNVWSNICLKATLRL